jgi:hypothetical protein
MLDLALKPGDVVFYQDDPQRSFALIEDPGNEAPLRVLYLFTADRGERWVSRWAEVLPDVVVVRVQRDAVPEKPL